MKTRRIGVAINTQHARAEDQALYSGVRAYSRKHAGFDCVLAPFATEDLKAAPRSKPPYDGILAQATKEMVVVAKRTRVPVVDVWRNSRVQVTINCVFPDFAKAGRMAGQHLVSRGFEHFGYVAYQGDQARATMCDATLINSDELGYVAYLEARGFACGRFLAPERVDAGAAIWAQWSKDIREWLKSQPKPLGLFVPEDLLCRYIADIAPELGLTIPHDLGLICADNEPNFCLLANPSLTSLDLGYSQVGYEAAAMLDRMLERAYRDLSRKDREILLVEPAALHPRHSTDAVAVRDPLVATAMRFILEHTHEPIMVKDVARSIAATRRTLERRFRDVLDRTVMEEITRCRIERLKRRLAESDTPIKILAIDSGFNSARVLYETFVRCEGMSPSAYRAKRRESIRPAG